MSRLLFAGIYLTLLTVSPVSRADEELSERSKRSLWADVKPVKTWQVVTIQNPPYAMKDGPKWVGFIPDLLKLIGYRFRVYFVIREVSDRKYGTRDNETGLWNGLIGTLVNKANGVVASGDTADLAAAPLTITAEREEVVNFVKPFQNLGLTILMKKSYLQAQSVDLTFNIINPLAPSVWVLCTISMVVVALVLWLMNRFNPYEWGGRYNLGRANEAQAESFNITGAFWFTFTTLQWQGYERTPRSIGSKLLSCFWFVFVTITMVTYTGSLINHLFWASTMHGKDLIKPPIVDLEHLVMGSTGNLHLKYGTIKGGHTEVFFNNAKGDEYDKIRKYFDSDEGQKNMVETMKDGFDKARKGNYAFLCESLIAKHEANKFPCDLTTVGEPFGLRSYGFALPNSTDIATLEAFHNVILELQQEGEIDALERKWWIEKGECYNQTKIEKELSRATSYFVNKPKKIDLDMFWGPLAFLLIGIVLSILIGGGESLFYKYKGRYQDRNRPVGQQLKLDEDGNI